MSDTPLKEIRVRKIISFLNTITREEAKKLLPKGIVRDQTIKDLPNVKYPTGILNVLPKGESYSTLGCIAEAMLRRPSSKINIDTLIATTQEEYPGLTEVDIAKIKKSITTEHFIERLVMTRRQLEESFDSDPEFEPTISRKHVQGHPDLKTKKKVFEVKLTGQVQENWLEFLFQAFAYAAIVPEVEEVNIVLPLQNIIWSFSVTTESWPSKEEYFNLFERLAVELQTVAADNLLGSVKICEEHCIGRHLAKTSGPFLKSIQHITDGSTAWQFFLSSNMSAKVSIKDEEIAPVRAHIDATGAKIFIHAPYIINLCAPPGADDDYHTECLIKITRIAAAMGCSGVVVHVGKYTTRPLEEAMTNMKVNLLRSIEAATVGCPILLETPAGQGTETLTDFDEFFEFIADFEDPRIRACVDTCHIFACGYDPVSYLSCGIINNPGLIKLIHYNDSLVECGAKVDRHAFMGLGKIGLPKMRRIAELATEADIPCIIEI